MEPKDFDHWTPNIKVSVWGRAKATLVDKSTCPAEKPPGAAYRGDCDMCDHFMGIRFGDKPVEWGDTFGACCWAILKKDTQ